MGVAAATDGQWPEGLEAVQQEVVNLKAALETRHRIGLAQGMLMSRYRLTEVQAFAYLARLSQDSNVKVRDLVDQVITDLSLHPE